MFSICRLCYHWCWNLAVNSQLLGWKSDENIFGCFQAKPLQCIVNPLLWSLDHFFPDFLYTISPISPTTNKISINVKQWGQFDKLRTLPVHLAIKRTNYHVMNNFLTERSWHIFCTITFICRLTIYIQYTFVSITNTF